MKCDYCKQKFDNYQIKDVSEEFQGKEEYEIKYKKLCNNCLDEYFCRCRICDELFLIKDMECDATGELCCREHCEEMNMDEEESEGWEDLKEYINK